LNYHGRDKIFYFCGGERSATLSFRLKKSFIRSMAEETYARDAGERRRSIALAVD